jgi:hypothetical protein
LSPRDRHGGQRTDAAVDPLQITRKNNETKKTRNLQGNNSERTADGRDGLRPSVIAARIFVERIAPGAGRLMADLVAGDRPIVDPSPFGFRRFVSG